MCHHPSLHAAVLLGSLHVSVSSTSRCCWSCGHVYVPCVCVRAPTNALCTFSYDYRLVQCWWSAWSCVASGSSSHV